MTEQNNTAPLLSVRDLQVVYHTKKHDVHAVNGISFDIQRKKTLGFVGETGAGKTTTALSLLRLLPERTAKVLHGSILFEGKDLMQLSERDMQKIRGEKIAMIFQDPMTALNPTVTVGEQIAEALLLHSQKGTSMEKIHQRVDEVLMLVGIPPERKKEYPHQFSGGMKQRLLIARALLGNPSLLILDEPTVGLDPKQITEIRELIKKLGKTHTVILSSHILSEVSQICNKVIIINKGKIVAIDTPQNLENAVSKNNNIYVTIEDPENKIETVKDKIEGIKDIKLVATNDDGTKHYCIESEGEKDLRKTIFAEFAKENITIYEMKKQDVTLEDAFIELIEGGKK